jgi:uncharacterized protein YggT (Ycf19 family)
MFTAPHRPSPLAYYDRPDAPGASRISGRAMALLVGSAVLLLAVVAPAATAAFTAGTPAPGLRSIPRATPVVFRAPPVGLSQPSVPRAPVPLRASQLPEEDGPSPTRATVNPWSVVSGVLGATTLLAGPALAGGVASVLGPILSLIVTFLNFYQFALFIRIILTWLPIDLTQPPLSYLCRITDPMLNGTRGLVPPLFGLDFGPTIVLLALNYCTKTLEAGLMQLYLFQ